VRDGDTKQKQEYVNCKL